MIHSIRLVEFQHYNSFKMLYLEIFQQVVIAIFIYLLFLSAQFACITLGGDGTNKTNGELCENLFST